MVQRPQDLKSIKAAISKGSKAAASLIEELEDIDDENPDPDQPHGIGNGYFYVEKNEDLVPPKGIVNLEQLEMELVRIFANAVMFNPLPPSERGFGRELKLRKRGELHFTKEVDEEEEEEGSQTVTSESESTNGSADELGIISDAREIFEDVERLISGWKAIEVERMGDTQAERQVSVSASSTGDIDESGMSFGSVRKRRKVADH